MIRFIPISERRTNTSGAHRPSAECTLMQICESTEEEEYIAMDAIHDPVLAEYWGDDADDDLIANP